VSTNAAHVTSTVGSLQKNNSKESFNKKTLKMKPFFRIVENGNNSLTTEFKSRPSTANTISNTKKLLPNQKGNQDID
jgi:hypothetical protein